MIVGVSHELGALIDADKILCRAIDALHTGAGYITYVPNLPESQLANSKLLGARTFIEAQMKAYFVGH